MLPGRGAADPGRGPGNCAGVAVGARIRQWRELRSLRRGESNPKQHPLSLTAPALGRPRRRVPLKAKRVFDLDQSQLLASWQDARVTVRTNDQIRRKPLFKLSNMRNDRIHWCAPGATPEGDEDGLDINRAYWPGLSAELARISKPQELAYRFQGNAHYLALHDIVRTDGETTIDGFARSVRRDIRDTLTFVPKGASVEDWSRFKDRRSSVLAIFFDPNADERGELRADDLPPRLYFEDPSLKQSIQKLNAVMSSSLAHEQTYAEHLGLIILCELRDVLLGRRDALAAAAV
jgi:hypothetical protein